MDFLNELIAFPHRTLKKVRESNRIDNGIRYGVSDIHTLNNLVFIRIHQK